MLKTGVIQGRLIIEIIQLWSGFRGSLKSERTDGKVYPTREQAKADVIDCVEMFYNCRRLYSTLNYQSPMQFKKQFLLNNLSSFI